MRQLLLLRHAKTERTNFGGDHARRLVERGYTDARYMGDYLAQEDLLPQCALVSDAARARETFAALTETAGRKCPGKSMPSLYLAKPEAIIDAIAGVPDDCRRLVVVGHNPGLHQLAFDLARSGSRKGRELLAMKFPTCALALYAAAIPAWRDLDPQNCRLERVVTAKSLRGDVRTEDDDC